jgi:endonuclease YncB( thermonuclease family)
MHRLLGLGLAVLTPLLTLVSPGQAQTPAGPAYVTRVADGDTLFAELGGQMEVVRYLGVNTPRIDHPTYGRERYALLAHEANRQMVEGKWVRLIFDGAPRDRDGRLLAYVWVGSQFVNALLVHRGYGEAAAASTSSYAEYFRMLQDGAQRDRRGLWRDANAQIFHRPRATEAEADENDRAARVEGGRVFSVPAPFIPSVPSSYAPSLGVPAGPFSSPSRSSSVGSPSYVSPRGSMRTR